MQYPVIVNLTIEIKMWRENKVFRGLRNYFRGDDRGLGRPVGVSLRVKGLLSLLAVVIYALTATLIVTEQRLKLPAVVKDLERLHNTEEQLVQLNMQIARGMLAVSESYFSGASEARTRQIFIDLTPLDYMMKSAALPFPELKDKNLEVQKLIRLLAHAPSQEVLANLRITLHGLVMELDRQIKLMRSEKQKVFNRFQTISDKITLLSMFFMFLGLVVAGAVMTIFFTRLTWDIRRSGARAMAIVKGYRGRLLEVGRGDEVGELALAINQMQAELRDRERQLELSRQQQFHQEKMAAVGSIAAAVAHEINNPIMAISGLAQLLIDQNQSVDDHKKCDNTIPEMIVEQSNRIAGITRQIFEFSAPQSPEPKLCHLNAIVQSTAGFVRFDQRYRRIDLRFDLSESISAVVAIPDHVTQVLINLLLNAADAFELGTAQHPTVTVSTRQGVDSVEVAVSDNGVGMESATLARAFDEFFTTKPRGKGTGLGLFLCRSLVEKGGGRVEIQSVYGKGTDVIVRFPLPDLLE